MMGDVRGIACIGFGLCIFTGAGGPSSAASDPPSGQARYYQALQVLKEGRTGEAIAELTRIVEETPGDPFADDALLELARIAEEIQEEPSRALGLYRQLVDQFPSSRTVRRARARMEFLSTHLGQGDAVLRDYLRIQRDSQGLPPEEAVARMEELLAAHPDFTLRPAGMYWMGSHLAQSGRTGPARTKLLALTQTYPRSDEAAMAWALLGNLSIEEGDLDAAEDAFRALARVPGERREQSSREALARLSTLRWRWRAMAGSVGIFAVVALIGWLMLIRRLRTGRPAPVALRRIPVEVFLYLVVMGGLIAWAWTGTRQTRNALLWMTGMVTLLLLPNGWLLRGWAPGKRWLVPWMLVLTLACGAIVVASIGLSGMTGQVLHTLEFGPD